MRGGGEETGPTREESGMVPAICLALLGSAGLPADGELVRGAHKQRQSSPTHPQGHGLFICRKKKEETYSLAEKRKGDGERERGGKRIGEENNKSQGRQKMLMRELKW